MARTSKHNAPASRVRAELKDMAARLRQCRIRTVAMQSAGVYWIAVYDILEEAGFGVYLVNARDTKTCQVARRTSRRVNG